MLGINNMKLKSYWKKIVSCKYVYYIFQALFDVLS